MPPPPPPSQQPAQPPPPQPTPATLQYSETPVQQAEVTPTPQKPGDVIQPVSNDTEKGDHIKPPEFVIKQEPGLQQSEQLPKVEPGVNIVVKEEVLDSNIIPTS